MYSDQHKHPARGEMPPKATRPLFQEYEFHYDRNRRQAKQSRVAPAITASGGPGVHLKIGAAFLYLTNSEAKHLVARLQQAMDESAGQVGEP